MSRGLRVAAREMLVCGWDSHPIVMPESAEALVSMSSTSEYPIGGKVRESRDVERCRLTLSMTRWVLTRFVVCCQEGHLLPLLRAQSAEQVDMVSSEWARVSCFEAVSREGKVT